MLSWNKALCYFPVVLILKALVNVTDEHIYKELLKGFEENQYYKLWVLSS